MGIDTAKLARVDRMVARAAVANTGFLPACLELTLDRLGDWAHGAQDAPFVLLIAGADTPGAAALLARFWRLLGGEPDVPVTGTDLRLVKPTPAALLARFIEAERGDGGVTVRIRSPEGIGTNRLGIADGAVRAFWQRLFGPDAQAVEPAKGHRIDKCIIVIEAGSTLEALEREIGPALGEPIWAAVRAASIELAHESPHDVVRGIRADLSRELAGMVDDPRAFVDTTAEVDRAFVHALELGGIPSAIGMRVADEFRNAAARVDAGKLPTHVRIDISGRLTRKEAAGLPDFFARDRPVGQFVDTVFDIYEI